MEKNFVPEEARLRGISKIKHTHGLTISEEAAQVDAQIKREMVLSLSSTTKVLKLAGGALFAYIFLIFVFTALFIVTPLQTARFLGIVRSKTTISQAPENPESKVLAATTTTLQSYSPIQTLLQPIGKVSLGIARNIRPDAYEQVAKVAILDPNDVLIVDSTGAITPGLPIKIPDSSLLQIGSSNLIANLNAQLLQGKQPGTNPGDLAIVGEVVEEATNTPVLTSPSTSIPVEIANTDLENSSVVIATSGPLSGGGVVALGGALALACPTCVTSISDLTASNLAAGDYSSKITSGTYSINITGSVATATDFTGLLIGDVTGTQGATTVGKINGAVLGITTPTLGNLLIGDGTEWVTQALSSDATITSGGVLTLKNTGTAGTYGSASLIPVFTTDAQGRISSSASTAIAGLTTSNFTSANISQWTNNSGYITSSSTDTLTNKTLTSPTINGIIATTGLTLPAFTSGSINGLTFTANATGFSVAGGTTSKSLTVANNLTLAGVDSTTLTFQGTDTYIGRTTSDTLTNKTLAAASNTISGLTNTNLSGTAGITNANLANSSLSFAGNSGSGSVALGGTQTFTGAGITNIVASGSTLTLTSTEADTLASVTGRGATTATALTLSNSANSITAGTLTATGGTINGIAIGASSASTGIFTTVNGLTFTNNGSNTLNLAAGKTFTLNNSLTFAGTDGTIFAFPTTSDDIAGRTVAQALTNKTIAAGSNTITGLTNTNLSGIAGITNANLENSSVTVTAGNGLSGGGAVSLGGVVSLANAGVTSLTGTSNQVNVSASTGAITLTLPQNIHSGASPTFAGLTIPSAPTATANSGTISLGNGPFDGSTTGFFTGNASGTQLAVNAASGFAGDLANFQVAGADKFKITADGHLGIGTTPGVNQPLIITKTFTDGTTAHNALTLTLDSTVTGTGVSQVRGQNIAVKNSATTTGTGVLSGSLYTMQGNGSQNYLTNNFTGVSISMTTLSGQSGTIVDTNAIRLNAPSFAGSKPTSVYGLNLFNQGVSGVTDSTALKIQAQSGSTSNYAITSAAGNLHGFGTTTPVRTVDVSGTLASTGATDLATTGASNVTIATTGTGTVAIGNSTGTFALTSNGGLNVTTSGALTGVASIDTISTSATGLTFAGAGTIASTTTGTLTLDSGTTGGILIGTGANAKTITLGNTTSTTAVNINSGTGNVNFTVDGTGSSGRVQIGNSATTTPDLLVLDNGTADPTGVNGGMYYNTGTGKFRCYENSAWTNCITPPGSDIQSAATYDTDEAMTNITSTQVTVTSVSVTPSAATGDVYVRAKSAIVSSNNADQSLVISIEDNGTCTGSTLATNTITITSGQGTVIGDFELTAIEVDAGASSQSYSLCASTATGDTDIQLYEMFATVIDTGADLAEIYTTNDTSIAVGDVVSLDASLQTGMQKSAIPYDQNVLGIISTRPGMVIGGVEKEGIKALPIALSGRVPVKISTQNGPINAGDYLTTSSLPGVAMKATVTGPIIGTAMSSYDGEEIGQILVFVKNGSANIDGTVANTNILDQITKAIAEIFKKTIAFLGNVIFHADVAFLGRPTFNKDTAGHAFVKAGDNEVVVTFEKEYAKNPIITANVNLVGEIKSDEIPAYAIYDVTAKGFKIKLVRGASFDMHFSWIALAVNEESQSVSQASSPLPVPSDTPIPTLGIEPTPTATLVPDL